MEMSKDFCAFILTHGRPDKVYTYTTLRNSGYTGKIFLIIDNEDQKANQYFDIYDKQDIIMFDKLAISKTFDQFDNFDDRRAIVYARNFCFEAAKKLGYTYFIQLDDDYTKFDYRINNKFQYPKNNFVIKKNLDAIFSSLLEYFKNTNLTSIALSQGGDYIGGSGSFKNFKPKRKCMNSFICSTDRPFQFIGRINEDVNTYTTLQSRGKVFLTIPLVSLTQLQTQTNSGGMAELYLDSGTYIKSFYTLITAPNCTKIKSMGQSNKRLHHSINWKHAVPLIIRENYKK
jgi:hypothetical protein